MGQKQTIIAQLLSAVEQHCMFFWLYLHDCVSQELDMMIRVKSYRPYPQFLLSYFPSQVVLESWAIVDRKWIIGNDHDICRVVFAAQQLCRCCACYTISNDEK